MLVTVAISKISASFNKMLLKRVPSKFVFDDQEHQAVDEKKTRFISYTAHAVPRASEQYTMDTGL